MNLMSIGALAAVLGVCTKTLRRWDVNGKLESACRTLGGHRRYDFDSVKRLIGLTPDDRPTKTMAYARVSSHDQKEQLETQALRLLQHCQRQGWNDVEVIKDLGSGMNCKKKGLTTLIQELMRGKVARLVLVTQDRLLRFGVELIFQVCRFLKVEIVILDETEVGTVEQQLVADIISIMTVFTSKLYGSRSRKNLRAIA